MVFVVIMVLAGIWQGQALLQSIQDTIRPPEKLSSCFSSAVSMSGLPIIVNNTYSYSTRNTSYYYDDLAYYNANSKSSACVYSSIEVNQKFPELFESIKPQLENLSLLQTERSQLNSDLRAARNNKYTQQNNYDTSLLENISGGKEDVYSSADVAVTLTLSELRISELERAVYAKDLEINSIQSSIKQRFAQSASVLQNVVADYDNELRILELKRFIISFVLLSPLVWFTMKRYFSSKKSRSEFSVIWGGAALIASVLFAQVLVIFVYRILPKRLLEQLMELLASVLQSFQFLIVLLQWLGFILIPLFFGYLVYKIQKKFYNPLAVAMRAIKEGKCPRCTMKIRDSMVFCPMCSYNLRVTCPSCSSSSVCFAKYCETCGKNIPDESDTSKVEAVIKGE